MHAAYDTPAPAAATRCAHADTQQDTAERRASAKQELSRAGEDGSTPSTATERLGIQQPNNYSSSSSFPDVGSGGSRLLSGNSVYAEDLERWIARFHRRQSALLFNSGYDANLGLMSCLPQRGDAVVCDELVHNSVRVSLHCPTIHVSKKQKMLSCCVFFV